MTFAQRGGQTALTGNLSRPPLQVMRPIRDLAGCLCVYLLSPTGGVVQGDRYAINIEVGDGAHALFTTQAATKVYKMPDGCAEQVTHVTVGRDAVFEYVPDAAILFGDSDYHQHLDMTLQPGALAVICEIVLPGRIARGERFTMRRYVNRTVVRDADGLVLHDASHIEPATADMDAAGNLDGYTCWGSLYLVGDLARHKITDERLRQQLGLAPQDESAGDIRDNMPTADSGIFALSTLHRNGFVLKGIAHHLETIYTVFAQFRAVLREEYLHLPAAPLRK